jgi:hypothetical protein
MRNRYDFSSFNIVFQQLTCFHHKKLWTFRGWILTHTDNKGFNVFKQYQLQASSIKYLLNNKNPELSTSYVTRDIYRRICVSFGELYLLGSPDQDEVTSIWDLEGEVDVALVDPLLGGHPLELTLVHKTIPVLVKQPAVQRPTMRFNQTRLFSWNLNIFNEKTHPTLVTVFTGKSYRMNDWWWMANARNFSILARLNLWPPQYISFLRLFDQGLS